MAGSGFNKNTNGSGGIDDIRLVPYVVNVDSSNTTFDGTNNNYQAQVNYHHKCYYGNGGTAPIRIIMPSATGNNGKWLVITSELDRLVKIAGAYYGPTQIGGKSRAEKPTLLFYCNGENWYCVGRKGSSVEDYGITDAITDINLIPNVVQVDGGSTTFNGSEGVFAALPNYHHVCWYAGPGGSYPIRIDMPTATGNAGKWLRITAMSLPVSITNSLDNFTFGGAGEFRASVLFHCDGQNWSCVAKKGRTFATYGITDAVLNSIYAGTGNKDNSAVAQFDSTNQGILIPRMTTAQRDLISSPANGLLIYNLTTLTYDYYNGSSWIAIGRQFQTFNTTFYSPLFLQDIGFTEAGTITRFTNNNGAFQTVEYSTNGGTSYTTLTFTANVWTGSISVSANTSIRFRVTFAGATTQGTLTIRETLT